MGPFTMRPLKDYLLGVVIRYIYYKVSECSNNFYVTILLCDVQK